MLRAELGLSKAKIRGKKEMRANWSVVLLLPLKLPSLYVPPSYDAGVSVQTPGPMYAGKRSDCQEFVLLQSG